MNFPRLSSQDSDGVEELYVKSSTTGGGLACFSRGKPRPYEYKRDVSAHRDGYLTSKESDESWESREETPWAEYTMQVHGLHPPPPRLKKPLLNISSCDPGASTS